GIAQLVRDHGADTVILECSGLADPSEVIDAVTDLYTARLAALERVIALLHPVSNEESHSSAYVTTQAIRCADELILNKRDLYVPGHWERFRDRVLGQNSYARLWETSHARIDPAALLTPQASLRPGAPTNVLFTRPQAEPRPRAAYHPIATTIRLSGPLNRTRFFAWIKTLPRQLERAKGYFRFTNEPELQEFQYAPPGQATVTPVTLLDEPEPALVLIGRGYDLDQVSRALLASVDR
ncbi:MAG TPA: GTP-binding protein, partial [Nitrospira sp.]|nr:GTP-binding protein [Nitrospira sp.]